MKQAIFVTILCVGLSAPAWGDAKAAGREDDAGVQNFLYQGNTEKAAAHARARLVEVPGDDQARFALGAVQFLQAVEHLGQALNRYGLSTDYQDSTGLSGLPILRLPVPENPDPEKLTYEALRATLRTFVVDLAAAEDLLAGITNSAVDFPLNIGTIRLDLNSDGAASSDEALWRMFKRVAGLQWLNEKEAAKFQTDFDESDVPWLRAYSHLLMAIAEFPLAHDWRDAFEATFQGPFPNAGLPLAETDAKAGAELEKLEQLPKVTITALRSPPEMKLWKRSIEGQRWQRIQDLRERIDWGGTADLIAFIHLNHWPVVEPKRMRSVLGHLETMVQLSRENWRRINAETDDRNEWIPSPMQSGVLRGMRVTRDIEAGWHQFLDEFDALLQGKKLIPHWRFDQGVNLRRIFLEPTTFDILLLIQGSAALPYLEDGELITGETWDRITHVFGGDFFQYFIWFN